jgi:hypothetical protein
MRSGLVQAAKSVAQECNEFFLGATAKAFGDVRHDGFGEVVDLDDEPLVFGKWVLLSECEDIFGPLPSALPGMELGEGARGGHAKAAM